MRPPRSFSIKSTFSVCLNADPTRNNNKTVLVGRNQLFYFLLKKKKKNQLSFISTCKRCYGERRSRFKMKSSPQILWSSFFVSKTCHIRGSIFVNSFEPTKLQTNERPGDWWSVSQRMMNWHFGGEEKKINVTFPLLHSLLFCVHPQTALAVLLIQWFNVGSELPFPLPFKDPLCLISV